jgi:RimJ/RimL family protein N-acetyltransferase
MEFETERLSIKLITIKDLEEIHEMNSFFEVSEFNTIGIPKDFSVTKQLFHPLIIEAQQAVPQKFLWVIRLKSNKEFIGEVGMNLSSAKYSSAEIHYSLHPHKWKNGFALEAVRKVLDFGFNSLNLHRIEAGVATGNKKSIRLLEKTGFLNEGTRRKILPIRGDWYDNYHYALLEEDYKTLN